MQKSFNMFYFSVNEQNSCLSSVLFETNDRIVLILRNKQRSAFYTVYKMKWMDKNKENIWGKASDAMSYSML